MEEAVNSATWTDIQVLCRYLSLHEVVKILVRPAFHTLRLAVLAHSAQLPVNGGRRNADHPGYEKH